MTIAENENKTLTNNDNVERISKIWQVPVFDVAFMSYSEGYGQSLK